LCGRAGKKSEFQPQMARMDTDEEEWGPNLQPSVSSVKSVVQSSMRLEKVCVRRQEKIRISTTDDTDGHR
jgi:hypothetical protein